MDTLNDLKDFHNKITRYKKLVSTPFYTDSISDRIQNLRAELQRSQSRLESKIKQYSGESIRIEDSISGERFNVFEVAFDTISPLALDFNLEALNKVLRIVNKAIGKLEAEGKTWDIPTNKYTVISKRPKAFISHSRNTQALTDLRDYLDELGIKKLIVMKKPNLNRDIDVKVEEYLDEADLVIILATGDSKDRNGNVIPAGNVLHEIGLSQAKPKFKDKIIYLLEEGAIFPSNIRPKGYIRFKRDKITYIFGDLTIEIKGMGFSI